MCGHIMVSRPPQKAVDNLDLAEMFVETKQEISCKDPDATTTTTATMDQDRPSLRRSSRKSSTSSSSTTKGKKLYVKHDYQDRFFDPYYDPIQAEQEREEGTRCGPRGGVVEPFPSRLYKMLKQAECDGFDNIVSWQPHGRCFLVHEPQQFVDNIMPRHFKQSKLTSFKRQVNLYGFQRLTRGPDRGAYYHPLFLRGRPDLHKRIVRMRVKGTGCKPTSSPETEPNFYALPICHEKTATIQVGLAPSNRTAAVADSITSNVAGPSLELSMGPSKTGKEEPKGIDSVMSLTTVASAVGLLNASLKYHPKDDQQQRRLSTTSSVDYRVSLQEKIQEVCAEPFLETLSEAPAPTSQGSAVGVQQSNRMQRFNFLRPLAAPRAFQKFHNFRPVADSPEVEGSTHCENKNGGSLNVDEALQVEHAFPDEQAPSLLPSTIPTPSIALVSSEASSQASSEPSTPPPPNHVEHDQTLYVQEEPIKDFTAGPMQYHHDPFKDQIKDLIHAPMPPMGKNDTFCEEDFDPVLDWFRGQPLQRAFC